LIGFDDKTSSLKWNNAIFEKELNYIGRKQSKLLENGSRCEEMKLGFRIILFRA